MDRVALAATPRFSSGMVLGALHSVLLWLAMIRVGGSLHRRWQTLVAAALTLGFVGACRSLPTDGYNLPIPPPAELLPKSSGIYEARGDVMYPGALVQILNTQTSLGYSQRSTAGAYSFEIVADCADDLILWYSVDYSASAERRQTVVEGCSSPAPDAGAP